MAMSRPACDYAQIAGVAAAWVGYELLSAFATGGRLAVSARARPASW